MNLPNLLTLGRLAMAGALIGLLPSAAPFAASGALAVFVLAAATDWLDGRLARGRYGVTTLGQLLDPLADKVLVCAALVSMVEIRLPGSRYPLVPAWIVVLIMAREFLVTGLRILAMKAGRDISAGVWGKHKAVWQMGAIMAMLAGLAIHRDVLPRLAVGADGFARWLTRGAHLLAMWVAVVTVASGVAYAVQHRELLKG